MIRFKGTVYYLDGREEPYEAGGAILAEWEDYAARHDYVVTPSPDAIRQFPLKRWQLYIAYSALGVPEGFDVWRRNVLDVDTDDEPEAVPPTLPEAFAVPSSNSQS